MHDAVEQPPALWQVFTEGILKRSVKKPLFGKPYLEFSAHMMLASHVYERGAILGQARPGSLDMLLQMCSSTVDTQGVLAWAFQSVAKRLASVEGPCASFFSFYLTGEAAKNVGHALPVEAGLYYLRMHSQRKHKFPLEISAPILAMSCTEGVAFGAVYPDLTEAMLRGWNDMDPDEWRLAREHGLDIPAEPPRVTTEQLEQEVLSVVAPFAAHFYPHLVEPLKLAL